MKLDLLILSIAAYSTKLPVVTTTVATKAVADPDYGIKLSKPLSQPIYLPPIKVPPIYLPPCKLINLAVVKIDKIYWNRCNSWYTTNQKHLKIQAEKVAPTTSAKASTASLTDFSSFYRCNYCKLYIK